MKKFTLKVSEPCHQNWEDMTKVEKGRFCLSCQKTVVDFTAMSDRQLAEFFKKPPASVCGRFYNDQLNREVVIPKKRIPWVKYFFHVTWPAMVLMLKSCGQQNQTMGEPLVKISKNEIPPRMPEDLIVGNLQPMFVADTLINKVEKLNSYETIMGDTIVSPVIDDRCTVEIEAKAKIEGEKIDSIALHPDSAAISNDLVVMMGAVAVSKVSTDVDESEPLQETTQPVANKVLLYPNPVSKGQSINVVLPQNIAGQYSIISMSGQVAVAGKITSTDDRRFAITNNQLIAGTYILQIISTDRKTVVTEKFIVH